MPAPSGYSRTIALLNIPDNPDNWDDTLYHRLAYCIEYVTSRTNARLLIVILSHAFHPETGMKPSLQSWKYMQKLISFIYNRASRTAINLNRILLSIDVVLHVDMSVRLSALESQNVVKWDAVFVAHGVGLETLPEWFQTYPKATIPNSETRSLPKRENLVHILPVPAHSQRSYPVVALGGTFDHLHAGHRILLSMSAWIASEKVIVGVTDDNMLTSKANRQVLEPIEVRVAAVRDFLALFKPSLAHDVVPIQDVYGPTGWDANIQALVVSKETLSGATAIAKHRAERSLPALETFVIDVIAGDSDQDLSSEDNTEALKNAKMSSTFIRTWIVKQGDGQP